MQLKLQRSQRAGLTGTVIFCLDIRAQYTPEEAGNIARYKLGKEVVYSSAAAQRHAEAALAHLAPNKGASTGAQFASLAKGAFSGMLAKLSLNVTIGSLGRGHHIECKDLEELLEAEDTLRTACKNITRFLDAAATFDGSEVVIEYVGGEERVHIAQGAPPLLEHQPALLEHQPEELEYPHERGAGQPPIPVSQAMSELGADFAKLFGGIKVAFEEPGWSLQHRKVKILIAGAVVLLLLYLIF